MKRKILLAALLFSSVAHAGDWKLVEMPSPDGGEPRTSLQYEMTMLDTFAFICSSDDSDPAIFFQHSKYQVAREKRTVYFRYENRHFDKFQFHGKGSMSGMTGKGARGFISMLEHADSLELRVEDQPVSEAYRLEAGNLKGLLKEHCPADILW